MVKGIKYAPLPTPPSAPSKRVLYFTKEVFFLWGLLVSHSPKANMYLLLQVI